jgi:hypothetical protein
MSQSTTDGNDEADEDSDKSTKSYVECTQLQTEIKEEFNLENWPHERQPGWSQYPSQDSGISNAPCSLGVPLTPDELPINKPRGSPFDKFNSGKMSEILVPETPESTPTSTTRIVRPTLNKKEAADQIERVTEFMEGKGYTVFTHNTKYGSIVKTMHLAFCMYEEIDEPKGINPK